MQIPTLYLKGTFNGWGLDTPFISLSEHCLQTTVCLSTDQYRFKISDLDGTENWTLSGHANNPTVCKTDTLTQLVTTQGIGNDLLFSPSAPGLFTLELNFQGDVPTIIFAEGEPQNHRPTRQLTDTTLIADAATQSTIDWHKPDFALPHYELFQQLAIIEMESFPFVFGDNVDGYYHGTTHSFVNSGKYRHHQGWGLGGFASFVDHKINDKESANHASLMPYGIEHHYSNQKRNISNPTSSDCLSIIQGSRLACLHVNAEDNTILAIVPELNIPTTHSSIHTKQNSITIELDHSICPEGSPRFISIAADKSISAKEMTLANSPELDTVMHLSENNVKLKLETQQPEHSLCVYLSFGDTLEETQAQALKAVEESVFISHQQSIYQFLLKNYLWTNDTHFNKSVMWARLSSRTFISHEFGTGIWAGLPWFKDCWGRDTFIALSGTSLVNGLFDEAKAVIQNFASMQMLDKESKNFGRIPNRVTSKSNIIYNTTDGTPWMIREALEYINYSGDTEFAKDIYPTVKRFIEGVEKEYLDSDNLMSHRHPDTWMDAKINGITPWSPRGPKANDIQALWFESVNCAMQLAELVDDQDAKSEWHKLSSSIKESFNNKFWDADKQQLADHLSNEDKPDYSIRPNQLMVLSIPQDSSLADDGIEQHIVKNAVETLLFPWGICSLQQEHIDFHPYHDNQIQYHKDAAYHNGTIWGWNAGFTVSALNRLNQQELSYELSRNLGQQILKQGCRGAMSENLDAYQTITEGSSVSNQLLESPLVESGTFAQAWSVSEYARNAQQDYLGYRPQLLANRIHLNPRLPSAWTDLSATLPYGESSLLKVQFNKQNDTSHYVINAAQATEQKQDPNKLHSNKLQLCITLKVSNETDVKIECPANVDLDIVINHKTGEVTTSTEPNNVSIISSKQYPSLDNLHFAKPDFTRQHRSVLTKDYLLNKRTEENLEVAKD
ncbi:amylo-alpha-1,6-glucosidase [Vibrio kagoshimensis]|uniref:amylo-alpha-1,6-glucosidase n=1 Tax=Vibrio kagoshimensis TaxID=2910244 RepID=UPI003D1F912E